jgi:hypothetical protein
MICEPTRGKDHQMRGGWKMPSDETRNLSEQLEAAIRSNYGPLCYLRKERDRLILGAVDLLLSLNESRRDVGQSGSLLTVLEWQRARDNVQAFLATLGVPLTLSDAAPSTQV